MLVLLFLRCFRWLLIVKRGGSLMDINYNRLWKQMIDKGYNKTMLREKAGISTNAVAKLGKNPVHVFIQRSLLCAADLNIVPDPDKLRV